MSGRFRHALYHTLETAALAALAAFLSVFRDALSDSSLTLPSIPVAVTGVIIATLTGVITVLKQPR